MNDDTAHDSALLFDSDEDADEAQLSSYQSNTNDFRLLEELGAGMLPGAYGTVYRAIWHGQLIATKVIEHDEGNAERGLITNADSFCPFEQDGSGAAGVHAALPMQPRIHDVEHCWRNLEHRRYCKCIMSAAQGTRRIDLLLEQTHTEVKCMVPVIARGINRSPGSQHAEEHGARSSLTEGAISSIMNHPNIVRTLGYEALPIRSPEATGTHEIRLLMEFCDRGSLDKAVARGIFHHDVDGVLRIRLQHLLKTLLEVAYAMRHLHNVHVLHRDLKIQNILLKSSNKDARGFTVKVSDFGLAKVWDGRGQSPTERQKYAGTVTHMAPELIAEGRVSTACDVYAFGILMWECYTALAPYQGLMPPQDLARWCWAQDPAERPTFSQAAKFLRLLLADEEATGGPVIATF